MVGERSSDRPRWAELVYTSVDRAVGGGWQVVQRSGGLDDEEEAELKASVVTAFDSHLGAPGQFLDADGIAALPIRFGAHDSAFGTVVWHATQAGSDATGRPGNVFTQVVLDRAAAGRPAPVALWRSPSFLTPYGAADVAAVTVPSPFEPVVSGAVDEALVVQQLVDPESAGRVRVLLDAVSGSRRGGAPVVLCTGDQDEAALLLAAVCALTLPSWSAGLRFSLYERGSALTVPSAARNHVQVVPATDRLPEDIAGFSVLRTDEEPQPGDEGEPHRTAAGSIVAVTGWSQLADELCLLPDDDVSAVIRALAARSDPFDGTPEWWLAALILGTLPEGGRGYDDVRTGAIDLLARLPAPLAVPDDLVDVLRGALAVTWTVQDIQLALKRRSLRPDDGRYRLLAERFVTEGLRRLPSLREHALPRLERAAGQDTIGNVDELEAAVVALADATEPIDLRDMTTLLAILELSGWLERDADGVNEPLERLVLALMRSTSSSDAAALVAIVERLPQTLHRSLLLDAAGQLDEAWQRTLLRAAPDGLLAAIARTSVDLLDARGLLLTPFGLRAAERRLQRETDPALVAKVAPVLPADRGRRGHDDPVQLSPATWLLANRAALAATAPGAVDPDDVIDVLLLLSDADYRDVRTAMPSGNRRITAAMRLRDHAASASARGRWPVTQDLLSEVIAMNRYSALKAPSVWFLVPLLILTLRISRRNGWTGVDPVVQQTLPRLLNTPGATFLEPDRIVAILVDILESDRDRLFELLVLSATPLTENGSNSALRRVLRPNDRDLVGEAIVTVLRPASEYQLDRIIETAEERYAERFPAGRLERLIPRRPPVAAYIDGLPAVPDVKRPR